MKATDVVMAAKRLDELVNAVQQGEIEMNPGVVAEYDQRSAHFTFTRNEYVRKATRRKVRNIALKNGVCVAMIVTVAGMSGTLTHRFLWIVPAVFVAMITHQAYHEIKEAHAAAAVVVANGLPE